MASANTACSASNEKSLSEWPALSDVCGNSRQMDLSSETQTSNNVGYRNNRRRHKPKENTGGYDSAKEKENLPQSVNGNGAKKKNSQKTNWIPVPIEHQPYKKRGNGRYFNNTNRGARNDGRGNFYENGRGNFRGTNSRRGRRDRDTLQYQPEEVSTNVQSQVMPQEHQFTTAFNVHNGVFYSPYAYSALHQPPQKELTLDDLIRYQVEYYFSDINLLSDRYLRSNMDKQGFVDIALIATFHRLKKICPDVNVIIQALKDSSKLELSDDGKVRPVVNPLSWVLNENSISMFDPYHNKEVIYPLANSMANMNLNGDPNPEDFNTYSMNGEICAGISGYNTMDVNSSMNIDFNSLTFKPVYLNDVPDINGISRLSPLNSNELEVDSKLLSNMDINRDISDNCAIYDPVDINDVSEQSAVNQQTSINDVSGLSPLNVLSNIEVDRSSYGTESVNGDISTLTKLDQLDVNCNTSRHISTLPNCNYEGDKSSYKNINVTEENVKFSSVSFIKDSTVQDVNSIDDVSKQNSLNLSCDIDSDDSEHDSRKLNGEAEKVMPVITFYFDFGRVDKDCNDQTVEEVSNCNSIQELVSMKSC